MLADALSMLVFADSALAIDAFAEFVAFSSLTWADSTAEITSAAIADTSTETSFTSFARVGSVAASTVTVSELPPCINRCKISVSCSMLTIASLILASLVLI